MSRIKKRQKGTTERKGLRRLRLPEIRPFRTGFPTGRVAAFDGNYNLVICCNVIFFFIKSKFNSFSILFTNQAVLRALRHALDAPGPTDPEVLSPSRQIRQHGIAARLVVGAVRDRGPTLVRNYRLVLRPEERNIIVLHETPVQLQRAAGGVHAQHPELTHRPPHAIPAIRAAQIAAALVKAVNNVALRGARD
nr:hypothetical protein KK1_020165 [Ipomoea batatas]